MKTEIKKLEKKLAKMRHDFCWLDWDAEAANLLACMIADCEKMLIHARILMLRADYSDHSKL